MIANARFRSVPVSATERAGNNSKRFTDFCLKDTAIIRSELFYTCPELKSFPGLLSESQGQNLRACCVVTALERRGSNLNERKDFYLKATHSAHNALTRPESGLDLTVLYICHIRWAATRRVQDCCWPVLTGLTPVDQSGI